MKKKAEAIKELQLIAARTATLSGHLRQFEMCTSKSYRKRPVEAELYSVQEHIEQLYGMVQRIALMVAKEWERVNK